MKKQKKLIFLFSLLAQIFSYLGALVMALKKDKSASKTLTLMGILGTLTSLAVLDDTKSPPAGVIAKEQHQPLCIDCDIEIDEQELLSSDIPEEFEELDEKVDEMDAAIELLCNQEIEEDDELNQKVFETEEE